MLRAVRFAARFGYEIEPETLAAINRCAPRINRTSAERKYAELTAMLTGGQANRAFEMLQETGLLAEVLPEAAKMAGVAQPPDEHPEGDVWKHTIKALTQLNEPSSALAWAVLLHDTGKPETFSETDRIRFIGHATAGARIAEEVCERLNMPGEEKRLIRDVVKNHMKFLDVKKMRESTLKRFLREPFITELLELHRIDRLASHGDLTAHQFCLDKRAEFGEEALRPVPLLDGHALTRMGFEPGPRFQEILTTLDDEQLEGRVQSREDAEAFVRRRFGASLEQGEDKAE
jgi:poly(A) polymerase